MRKRLAPFVWGIPRIDSAVSGIPEAPPTIKRMEGDKGPGKSAAENVEAVRRALEAAGVIFLADGDTTSGGAGVRLKGTEL